MMHNIIFQFAKNSSRTLTTLVFCLVCVPLHAETNSEGINMLTTLFPGAEVTHHPSVLGNNIPSPVLSGLSLRGKKGFVPLHSLKVIELSPTLAGMAFPIYLHPTEEHHTPLIGNRPSAERRYIKLLQVIFYDPQQARFLGKPPGYPLSGAGWTCGGDICDTLTLIDLEGIPGSQGAVLLKYQRGVETTWLQVLALNGVETEAAVALPYGDLGGESGIEASVHYTQWHADDGGISVVMESVCESGEVEFCTSLGLPTGRHTQQLQIQPRPAILAE